MNERDLTTKILKAIKTNYPLAFCYKVCDRFTSGIPDILACYKGYFIGLELKVYPNKTSKIQEYVMKQIKASKGYAVICYSVEDAMIVFKSIDGEEVIKCKR